MLTIIFTGSSLFITSQILKDKGYDSLASGIPIIGLGAFGLWLLWKLPLILM